MKWVGAGVHSAAVIAILMYLHAPHTVTAWAVVSFLSFFIRIATWLDDDSDVRAAKIVRCIAGSDIPISANLIGYRTGLPVNRVYYMARLLENEGVLESREDYSTINQRGGRPGRVYQLKASE